MPIPKPLDKIFEVYCHANALNIPLLADHCKRSSWSYAKPDLFEKQLRELIISKSATISEYEELTNVEFETTDELYSWLNEIWAETVGKPL